MEINCNFKFETIISSDLKYVADWKVYLCSELTLDLLPKPNECDPNKNNEWRDALNGICSFMGLIWANGNFLVTKNYLFSIYLD